MRNPIIEEDLQYIVNSSLPWHRFEGKTILISGANGFLPAYMVETILYLNEHQFSKKAHIIAIVRSENNARSRFGSLLQNPSLQLVVQDICEPYTTDVNIDFIIHAASQASPKYYAIDPVGTLSANILGTLHLLNLAREKQVEAFLFFSSGEVYGELEEKFIPTKETYYGYTDPMNVRSCYGESKRMAENMCVSWFHQYQVPTRIVRPFHTYGPGMKLDDGRVFADFVHNLVTKQDIVMKSDGSSRRAFCYLADATIGFFTVLFKGANAEAYNVGNEQGELSIMELAETLVSLFPDDKIRVIKETRNDSYLVSKIHRNCPDITKARDLGWSPAIGIEAGFRRTVLSFTSV